MYLIAAVQVSPAFFLGTLGALLLVSHPRTRREWFWIAVSIGALVAWFRIPDSLAEQTVRASAAFFVGVFVALSLAGLRPLVARAGAAMVVAALAMVGWYAAFHLRFTALENEIITQTWDAWRQVIPDLPAVMPPGADILGENTTPDRARQVAWLITSAAALFPGSLGLTALIGTRLSWAWYHRIAKSPILPPARPFREFRFNDQLVWLLVATIGTLLLSRSRGLTLGGWNVFLVLATLYALRGAAIVRSSLLQASPFFIGILLLIMLPLFTVVPVGLALLGIADTWVDFRRRMAPPTGVPS